MANGFSSSSQVQTRREISRSATTYRVEWEDVKKKKKERKKKGKRKRYIEIKERCRLLGLPDSSFISDRLASLGLLFFSVSFFFSLFLFLTFWFWAAPWRILSLKEIVYLVVTVRPRLVAFSPHDDDSSTSLFSLDANRRGKNRIRCCNGSRPAPSTI